MMPAGRYCRDCVEGPLGIPSGRCRYCDGTGTNTQLDAENPKCPYCHGTGTCPSCHGTGRYGELEGDIQTLFGN